MTSTINMTAEDQLQFENAIRNASEILYRYSNPELCQSFEHLEDHLRHQILEFVAPQVTLFLSKSSPIYPVREECELLKVVSER